MCIKENVKLYILGLVDIILFFCLLLSYYIKKNIGAVLFNYLFILLIIVFILFSILIIFISKKKKYIFFIQILVCIFVIGFYKYHIEDNFAFLFEIPRIEKKIKNNEYKNEVIKDDQYLIFEWEPGFLDYQTVLVYDESDKLENKKNEKIRVSEGKLYVIKKAKKGFYLCILYR